MKVTINWLREFLATEELDPEIVAERLTMSGTEVSKVEKVYESYKDIVTGQIIDFKPHPDADKLSVCTVLSGGKELSIVCGADNFKKDDKVVIALAGAELPGGMKIKKARLRGVLSEGMMCSEEELGLSSSSEGIMILDEDTEIGVPFAKLAGLDDTIIEMEITPNRPDCMSVIGIARELSAIMGIRFIDPLKPTVEDINTKDDFTIDIKDPGLCPRYTAKVFCDIPAKETPLWLKNRLILCDQRPVNLLVDLTNYIMLETGQPLHAFDKDLLGSDKIMIRTASSGERIRLIDGSTKILGRSDLVIADENGSVAIAGVMGGKETEINENTRNVFLESANFFGPSIMGTSKTLNLRTEASNRFEKKIDPELTLPAIIRFEEMLAKIAGKVGSSCVYDSYPKKLKENKIKISGLTVRSVLGAKIPLSDVKDMLQRLGFKISVAEKTCLEVKVPTYRAEDVQREIDLVEEVARIYGFNRFKSIPPSGSLKKGRLTEKQSDIRRLRDALSDIGLNEVINYSFISKELMDKTRILQTEKYKDYVEIINPINEDFRYLRTTLLPSLLKNVQDNSKYNNSDLKIFEISKVFFNQEKLDLPTERDTLGLLITGRKNTKDWLSEENFLDYYDIKGYLEFLEELFTDEGRIGLQQIEYPFFHPRISADIKTGKEKIGIIGKLHPLVLEEFGAENDTFYLEIDIEVFLREVKKEKSFKKITQYPSVDIDIAITLDEDIENISIVKAISDLGGDLLKQVDLFDVYTGEQIEKGKKSMAYSLIFRAENRTLKDTEVDIIVKRILEGLKQKFNARLRE